jgi:hypothetical protein
MSAITRGIVAALLLAGAVVGAVAIPRFVAGPGSAQTPSFAVAPNDSQPAIIRAQPAPVQSLPTVRLAAAPVAGIASIVVQPAQVTALPQAVRPIVIHRVPPPARVAPKPAPATPPAQAPEPTPAPEPAPAAPVPTPSAPTAATPPPPKKEQAAPSPAPAPAPAPTPSTPAPAPSPKEHGHGKGKGKDNGHGKHDDGASTPPIVATDNQTVTTDATDAQPTDTAAQQPDQTAPLGSGDGSSAQAPTGTAGGDGGAVGHLEAPDAQAAPPDHGHGPPPWANGHGKGH